MAEKGESPKVNPSETVVDLKEKAKNGLDTNALKSEILLNSRAEISVLLEEAEKLKSNGNPDLNLDKVIEAINMAKQEVSETGNDIINAKGVLKEAKPFYDEIFSKMAASGGVAGFLANKFKGPLWDKITSTFDKFLKKIYGFFGIPYGDSKGETSEASKSNIETSLKNLSNFPGGKTSELKFNFDKDKINQEGDENNFLKQFINNYTKLENKDGGDKKGDTTRVKNNDFWEKILGKDPISDDAFLEKIRKKVSSINIADKPIEQKEFFKKLSELKLEEEKKPEVQGDGNKKPEVQGDGTQKPGSGTQTNKPEGNGLTPPIKPETVATLTLQKQLENGQTTDFTIDGTPVNLTFNPSNKEIVLNGKPYKISIFKSGKDLTNNIDISELSLNIIKGEYFKTAPVVGKITLAQINESISDIGKKEIALKELFKNGSTEITGLGDNKDITIKIS